MLWIQIHSNPKRQDDDTVIRQRLAGAQTEMAHYPEFDYLVINDRFEAALDDLCAIVQSARLGQTGQQQRLSDVLAGLLSSSPASQ